MQSHVGLDEERNLCKGIVTFMVVELKQSIPLVVQAIPEVTFNGEWLAVKISDNIDNLIELGLCTEAVARRCSVKRMFLEISQDSEENTCDKVSFLIKLQA